MHRSPSASARSLTTLAPIAAPAAHAGTGAPRLAWRAPALVLLVVVACVGAWTITYQFPAYGLHPPRVAAELALLTAGRWVVIGGAGALAGWRLPVDRAPGGRWIALLLAVGVPFVGLVLYVEQRLWAGAGAVVLPMDQALARGVPGMIVAAVGFVGLGAGLHRMRWRRERGVARAQMEATVARARLRVAQHAVRPEFLISRLEAVDRQMDEDPRRADGTLVAVAEFLRLALRGARADSVPLAQEVEFVQAYLHLGRCTGLDLTLHASLTPEAAAVPVPHSILLLLVEGAAVPGALVLEATAGPRLCVSLRAADGAGAPFGAGLDAGRALLAGRYGAAASVREGSAAEGGGAVLELPVAPDMADASAVSTGSDVSAVSTVFAVSNGLPERRP